MGAHHLQPPTHPRGTVATVTPSPPCFFKSQMFFMPESHDFPFVSRLLTSLPVVTLLWLAHRVAALTSTTSSLGCTVVAMATRKVSSPVPVCDWCILFLCLLLTPPFCCSSQGQRARSFHRHTEPADPHYWL